MGCAGSSPAPDPTDLSRPADVPCPRCGAFNYLDAGKAAMDCYKCASLVTRHAAGATGMQSSAEASDAKLAKEKRLDPARTAGIAMVGTGMGAPG